MKQLRELVRRAPVVKFVAKLLRQMKRLEDTITVQSDRLSDLEAKEIPSIHSLELIQEVRIQNESDRHAAMSEPELRRDLEKEYGGTKWAKKLINEIMAARVAVREIRDAA